MGLIEIIIVLVIVVLIFGVGRISKLGGDLGKGVRAFRQGFAGDKDAKEPGKDSPQS